MERNPIIFEINTWVWLDSLSRRFEEHITLGNVPDDVITELAAWHFDAIWLMGVWKRSPEARKIAQTHPGLLHEYSLALPDLTTEDIVGSPYAVHQYTVEPMLGGRDELASLRARFAQHGIKLILDYVPNHVAIDHHWTGDAPEALVRGTSGDLEHRPGYYYTAENGYVFAHGRDPYFPAWTDTAQIDAFSEHARDRTREVLIDIGNQCDGVRCDMAMLLVSRIFSKTWDRPDWPATEFWQDIIPAVKAAHDGFIFLGEIYWQMESEMIALGFDYAYDKRLYDRLRDQGAAEVRDHLLANLSYQERMVRFTENHDEKRAAEAFGVRSKAAAVATTLLPGATLLHQGQFEGWKRKLPVQLGRRYPEPTDEDLLQFFRRLVEEASAPVYHDGVYMALAANPILGTDPGPRNLIAFAWALGSDWRVIIINYADQPTQARVMLPNPAWRGAYMRIFRDSLDGSTYQVNSDSLLAHGLEVNMPPFGVRVLHIE